MIGQPIVGSLTASLSSPTPPCGAVGMGGRPPWMAGGGSEPAGLPPVPGIPDPYGFCPIGVTPGICPCTCPCACPCARSPVPALSQPELQSFDALAFAFSAAFGSYTPCPPGIRYRSPHLPSGTIGSL